MKQEAMADIISVHYTTYASYEKGKTNLELGHAKKFADYFNMSLDDFFNYGEDSKNIAKEPQEQYVINRRKSVQILVTLDGNDGSLKEWWGMLSEMNKAIRVSA